MKATKDEKLLTTTEAAQELRQSPATLKNWRSKGEYDLPFVKIGGSVFYRETDIRKAKKEGLTKKPTPCPQSQTHLNQGAK